MSKAGPGLPTLTILHGEDEFGISEMVRAIKGNQEVVETGSFNVKEFDGAVTTLAELRSICDTMPFLAEQRLVIVYNVLGLARRGGVSHSQDPEFLSGLIEYLPSQSPFCALVLVEHGVMDNEGRRRKKRLINAAKEVKGADIQHYPVHTGDALVRWIVRRATELDGEFSQQAARSLALAQSGNLRLLNSEIEKLLTYVDRKRMVSVGDVDDLTDVTGQANIFHLVDAVAQRNGRQATDQLRCLLDQQGYQPMQVFGMIVRQYRLLLQAKEILDTGGDKDDVQDILKLHPFPAGKVIAQSRRYSALWLETIHRRLLELDVAMKSGADHKASLDLLVGGLTS